MAKKARHEEHENLERWLVSYADFITLLFAFFVMLYAISSLNTGKFRVMSNAITATFQHKKVIGSTHVIIPKDNTQQSGKVTPNTQAVMVQAIQLMVEKSSRKGNMEVVQTKHGIVLRIQSKLLFESGHAKIRSRALPVLKSVAGILAKSQKEIRISGYTDNQPIRTSRYPNNWVLSTMRAVNVLTELIRDGPLSPQRAGAAGFGRYRPIASNLTASGREKNRRVEILILNREYHPPHVLPMENAGPGPHQTFPNRKADQAKPLPPPDI
ncbi:MAG: flagellar motor protein MotB [Leptospirillum sp.]|jgi:chemotaxis protein MotB|nr:OmpA family protein [Nitrospiraceae bacterium]